MKDLSYIVGSMGVIIFIYRFTMVLLPMLIKGIKEGNYETIFNSFTLLA
mgnify:CR=1 FL=1|tara:strand:+ start:815 stop:961 length:147 start_codon:yes stop_codon:yes gene_type:complete